MSIWHQLMVEIKQWRAAYAAEPPSHITSLRPPKMSERIDGVRMSKIDHGTRVGQTLSGDMLRYLDGSGGQQYPVHDALRSWDRLCRRAHTRWPDHRGRPVCADIVWAVIRDQCSPDWASERAGVSVERGLRLLRLALSDMRQRQESWLADSSNSATHDRDMCSECRSEDSSLAGSATLATA